MPGRHRIFARSCKKNSTLNESSEKLKEWENPSSYRHLSKMPIQSVILRHKNVMQIHHRQKRQLIALRKAYDVELCEQSSGELVWMMETVTGTKDLEDAAAYQALRDFEILALPHESSLKRMYTKNNMGAGIHESKIADQLDALKKYEQDRVSAGLKTFASNHEGVLIFDEVKVAVGVTWNSNTHKIASEATTASEASDLHNVFQTLDSVTDLPTSHILQTLWRVQSY
eukprot:Pompholyxophrys_punicea_v1_NODE_189_length_2876_cov_7.760723.p1 type:complete len:228 gc:universal NODE_189_length_2876_cov_7.760723:1810-1127(-)